VESSVGFVPSFSLYSGGALDAIWTYNNTILGAGGSTENQDCVQLEGTTLVFENNAVANCNTLVQTKSDTPSITTRNNIYAAGGGSISGDAWQWGPTSTNCGTLSCWQAASGGDAGPPSAYYSSFTSLLLNNNGSISSAGSPLSGKGTNLYSLCGGQPSPGIGALCYDTSAGHTRTPVARPSSGAWDVGAYVLMSPTGARPAPPTNLVSTVN